MPFVTEEIWSLLGTKQSSVMKAEYPRPEGWDDQEAEREQELGMGVITSIRNIRGEMNIPPSTRVNVILFSNDQSELDRMKEFGAYIEELARAENVTYQHGGDRPKKAAASVVGDVEIFVPLAGIINIEEEIKRLEKEIKKATKEIAFIQKKLDNEDFVSRAPEAVVEKEKEKFRTFQSKLEKLDESMKRIQALA
jgi:valyl-tRNA synthetase